MLSRCYDRQGEYEASKLAGNTEAYCNSLWSLINDRCLYDVKDLWSLRYLIISGGHRRFFRLLHLIEGKIVALHH